jgi:hypothetical protein
MRKKSFMVAFVVVSSFTLCVGLTAASNAPQNKAGAAPFATTDDAATAIALAGSAWGPGGF